MPESPLPKVPLTGMHKSVCDSQLAGMLQRKCSSFRIYFHSWWKNERDIWPYCVQNATYSLLISCLQNCLSNLLYKQDKHLKSGCFSECD